MVDYDRFGENLIAGTVVRMSMGVYDVQEITAPEFLFYQLADFQHDAGRPVSIYYDYAFPAGNGGSVYPETAEHNNSFAYFLFFYAGGNLCRLLA